MKIFNAKSKNNKNRRTLTKNEFILVTTLIFGIAIYTSMNYLLLPKWDVYQQSMQQLQSKKVQCEDLHNEFKNLRKIKDEKSTLKCEINEVIKRLPPYISEEDIILTIGKYGREHSISIQSVALDKENSSKANNFINSDDKNGDGEQSQSNKEASDASGGKGKGKAEEVAEPTVLTKYITVAFSGKVENLYSFIENFEKNYKKLAFKEMALNKDKDSIITGTIKFQYIGYKDGKDGSKYNLKIPKENGKITPFDGEEGKEAKEGEVLKKNESEIAGNFSLILNPCDDEAPKFIFGEYKKMATEIYNSTNGKISGKFTIDKEKGSENFAYTYSLANNTKTEKKKIEIINGRLIIKVESNPRELKEDITQISLDVENKTEYPLEIYISNDDAQNPRFVLGNKQGNVYLKKMGK